MDGFFLIIGKQGSGKTLMTTKHAFDMIEEYPDKRVFSNYKLNDIDFTYITFNSEIESNKNKLDILKTLDENPDYFNNSIMLIDELHLYLDSYDFLKKNNRRLQIFFSQLRKRRILLIGTTQYIMNVDIRIRRQCLAVMDMTHIRGSLFKVDTLSIDGYYTELVSSYKIDLRSYFNKYDTYELIL